ncbi:amino acid permease [Amnibacterium sp. CER49]|uniref:APC family permease n=1 Tax=Amnibacterium sp. CER49 TaxID=3039161 RepID=UPI0024485971|nr:amino acid permease [Amnibacterium sp. CER49]MDH2442425.1 amino acid permease [Amnibacterium sp. CER49]
MTARPPVVRDDTDENDRLIGLGYRPELRRVLGLFDNFSIAFSYLSPMVGVYSLFVLGAGAAGPAYIWLMIPVVAFMLLVALVFGELGSHYPLAGALYQYAKRSVSPAYGWWVGWIYGLALLVTVASVDTGLVGYLAALLNDLFGLKLDPTNHALILGATVALIVVQTIVNTVGAKAMGYISRLGVYVETIGTFGVAIALAVVGFHHGFDFLFTSHGAESVKTNTLGVDFGGSWIGAALVAVLAHSYIFYGFESAGDIAEETKNASRQVPRAMRSALLYGGIASFVLVAGLLLATPATAKGYASAVSFSGGVPVILGALPQWLQDVFLLVVLIAFFSCGTAVQGAGSRLLFSYARDRQLPASGWMRRVSPRFQTPANALLVAGVVPVLFTLLVNINPAKDVHILWFVFPAGINALTALVSFGVSGIYLSFLLTVIGSMIARSRGWQPAGVFRLGRWGWPVSIAAALYLAVMLIDIVLPSGLSSPRGALFNLDWITLAVMVVLLAIGAVYFLVARPDRRGPVPAGEDTEDVVPVGR